MSTNLHCGKAASHKAQKNRMLKNEVSCYSWTIYLSYLDTNTRKRLVGEKCPPIEFNVTSEPKWIHIYPTYLNRKLHNEMRQMLAIEREKNNTYSEAIKMFWVKCFSREIY